jgi:hypothetical protein
LDDFTDQLIDQIVYRLYGLTPEKSRLLRAFNKQAASDVHPRLDTRYHFL